MIFIDTGAFVARYIERDQYHQQAIKMWEKIYTLREQCYTSNFVLDETLTLLGRWAGYVFAAQKAHIIYSSPIFIILRPDQDIELKAIELFGKYADQKISFTDCVSFVLMKEKKIKRVFSFDRHFSIAGFNSSSS